jgi:hypothetical protein
MTAKQITTVDFSEIGRVQITCKCGTAFDLPVQKEQTDPPRFFACLGCRAALWLGDQDARFKQLADLLRALSHCQEMRSGDGFSLSFNLEQKP